MGLWCLDLVSLSFKLGLLGPRDDVGV